MKDGTSQTSTSQVTAKAEVLRLDGDEVVVGTSGAEAEKLTETVTQFLTRIAVCQAEGHESIETTPEVIKHFNPKGLGTADYFIYKGVKVFPHGRTDEILSDESVQMGQRLHGTGEGKLDNH